MMRPDPDRPNGARACPPLRRRASTLAAGLLAFAGLAANGAAVTGVAVVSDPGTDNTYTPVGMPDDILVDVTFDDPVAVSGSPTFVLMVGDQRKSMSYADGSGSATLQFEYTVRDGDLDLDGVSHPANALSGRITNLDDGEVADTSLEVARYPQHRVDGVGPRIVGNAQVVSSPDKAGTYAPDEEITIRVRFDEDLDTAAATELTLVLGNQEVTAEAPPTSASNTLEFVYEVVSGDLDEDGFAIRGKAITVADAFGNSHNQTVAGLRTQQKVDGVPPEVVGTPRIVSRPQRGNTYAAGEEIEIEVRFSEAVYEAADAYFELQVGDNERRASYDAGNGTNRLRFSYEVSMGDRDADGISWAEDALNADDIEDIVEQAPLATDVAAVTAQTAHRVDAGVDTEPPVITGVAIVSTPANARTYAAGQAIVVGVTFSETVDVTGSPALTLSLGAGTVTADFDTDSSGTRQLLFEYTVANGDEDRNGVGVGPIADTLVGGTIADNSGNTAVREFRALPDQSAHRVDGVPPTVRSATVTSEPASGETFRAGEAIDVTVEFSEPVAADHDPDLYLGLQIGVSVRRARLASGDGTGSLVFRYRVQNGDVDADGVSLASLAPGGCEAGEPSTVCFGNGSVRDLPGNALELPSGGLQLSGDQQPRVDAATAAATVTIVSDAGDDVYTPGDTIEFEVMFAEAIRVSGSPELVVLLGPSDGPKVRRRARLVRERPMLLAFSYQVQADDLDADGVSVDADALVGGTITDEAGNPLQAVTPLEDAEEHQVDGVAPRVSAIRITSNAGPDSTYGRGDAIDFAVTFTDSVHLRDFDDELALAVGVGGVLRPAPLREGTGTSTLHFRYVVQPDDFDEDGISVPTQALRCNDEREQVPWCLVDAAGNEAPQPLVSIPAAPEHRIDSSVTRARLMHASDPVSAGGYRAGEHIEVELIFPVPVHVRDQPELLLSIGGQERRAGYFAGSGTGTLRFRYTVVLGDFDDDGFSVGPGPGSLAGGVMVDDDDVPVSRRFGALGPIPGQRVDAVVPTAISARIVSTPLGDGGYGISEQIVVEVLFDEPVSATGVEELALVIEIGPRSRRAAYVDGSGTDTYLFAYRIDATDVDDDGVSIGPDAVVGGVIVDAAGNPWDVDQRRIPPVPPDRAHRVDPGVDRVEPSVNQVEIVSAPLGSTYLVDEVIEVAVTFSELVHVTGAPALRLSIGRAVRDAAFAAGSGTAILVFRYAVQSDDLDQDGISVGPGPASLAGGVIEDDVGNQAVRDFKGLLADPRHTVNVGVMPEPPVTVAEVRIAGEDAVYAAGDDIEVEVEFSDEVHVTGEPVLALSIGANTRQAAFAAGSGTDTLLFRYTVVDGDEDDDGISIAADALAGGRIESGSGIPAVRDFEAVGPFPRHRVATTVPAVATVAVSSDAGEDAVYAAGDVIEVAVGFTEVVHVTGEPVLALSIGANTRQAAFAAGSGTDTLLFRYTVVDGDEDGDGISIAANALAGGRIESGSGIPAVRDFEAVGPFPGHSVCTIECAPMVNSVAVAGEDAVYAAGDVIEVAVGFTEVVHVTGEPVLALSIGANTRQAAFAAGSATDTLLFRYTVVDGDEDGDGISIAANALAGGRIESGSGIPAVRDFEARGPFRRHLVCTAVCTIAPMVASVAVAGEDAVYAAGDVIEVAVGFTEVVHVTGDPVLALRIGADTRQAAFAAGSGTETLLFRYTVVDGDEDDDGISIAANALVGGRIESGSGIVAVRDFEAVGPFPRHRVATTVPAVATVAVSSDAGDDAVYAAGDVIEVAVGFTEVVHVTGDPVLTLRIGADTRQAAFAAGSATETLLFRYTVVDGDEDDDGISIAANALVGGRIESGSGIVAVRDFEAVGPFPRHRVATIAPMVASVAVSSEAGDDEVYTTGDVIEVAVEFSEIVHVTGDPVLALRIGADTRQAAFAAGSATEKLLFRYTVVDGDADDDGISIAADALTGGGITGRSGIAAVRDFEARGPFPRHGVDTAVPTVATVVVSSDAGADTAYLPGDVIEVAVEFNDVVHVTGDPVLALSIGANTRQAAFATGSGTERLLFRYTVVDGDLDDDGISIAADALTGGQIESGSGNAADRAFAAVEAQREHRVLNSVELAFAPLDATVGRDQTIDLAAALATAGIAYAGGFSAASDAPSVVEVGTMANLLTVTPLQEGTATITITAVQAPITLFLAVTVTASAEEEAILESSLAAVGRALLSSVSATVGTRLESPDAASGSASHGYAPPSGWQGDGLLARPSGDPLDLWHPDALADGRDQGYRLPPQAFAMSLGAGGDARGWTLWGALDVQSFSGEPDAGSYDGSLRSLHIGADVRGDGWVAGASASRSTAEVSYDLAGDEARSGTLETELNAVYPYVRWTPADGTILWTVLGLGTGEAYHGRDGPGVAPVPDAPGQLSMRLGLAGLKTRLGAVGGVSLALRGDAGFVRLDTDDGLPAAQGLAAAAQRVRAGIEASVPVATGGGTTLTPFLDLGGRWDGGDGDTGGGAELAAGIRVKGPMGGVELKARSLVVPGTEGQAETGVSATAYLTPGANRAGWRLALSPRWGDATARDVMWQSGAALRRAGRRSSAPGWTVGGELGRGFELRDRSALVTPFGKFDLGRDDAARRRIGVRYERNDAGFSVPLRVELSGERVAQPGRGADNRVLITAEARR